MQQRVTKKMLILTGIVLFFAGIVVFFSIPYSRTRTEFAELRDNALVKTSDENSLFTEGDIAHLPSPVQRYFRYCGYIGTPKMKYMNAICKDVDFSFGKGQRTTKIDYTQYNSANKPMRIAYIDSSMYGIPFEGLDSYTDGNGSMKGVLAKLFTLFNQTGSTMDKACLVTYLSECLIIPNAAIQDCIAWEEIDDLHAKASISYHGTTASGVFTFGQDGQMLSFTTNDRTATAFDGTSENVRWSAILGGYVEVKGIKRPTVLQAVWHYDDGDLLYFDGKDVVIRFDYEQTAGGSVE